ncbi:MAG: flagellar hook capping FlgD N-terminal domain-containing protein [Selenomonadales bacterium]|nr:flagellar hook capping FlgD N-terminal domain-containing protein [Selenomonadales bacterium]
MSNSLNTITKDGVTQTVEAYNAAQNKNSATNSTLGKDAFLQLLVTQMRYQDPLDPQDNSEYLSQLAQFSALEQMTNVAEGLTNVSTLVDNINTSVLVGQLSNMIGQPVQWQVESTTTDENGNTSKTTTTYEGKVKGISLSDGSPSIIAESNGKTYKVKISDLTRIGSGEVAGS